MAMEQNIGLAKMVCKNSINFVLLFWLFLNIISNTVEMGQNCSKYAVMNFLARQTCSSVAAIVDMFMLTK